MRFGSEGSRPAASLETTLELWSTTLRQAKHRMRPLFAAPSVAASADAFLDGLLGAERRKTGWMRAEAAGDPGPWRQQAILGRSYWNADALRDVVRDHVIETLGAPEPVLVIDETGFLKQGHASCGVGRQYTGSAGKITNCQIGVFAAYVSDKGHAFVDRQLYLPNAWTGDPARMTAAHVPAGITFATKPRLALGMVERAIAAGVPFAWATADTAYGVGEIELALRRAYKGYVLGVTGQHSFWSWGAEAEVSGTAEEIATALVEEDWIRLSAGGGTKGPRLFYWAYRGVASLEADAAGPPPHQRPGARGLLGRALRRRLTPPPPRSPGAGGRVVFWGGAACGGGACLFSRGGAGGARRSRSWWRSRGGAGPSKTRSRPPRPNSDWPTMRAGRGTAGTGMSRWSCWPSPCWRGCVSWRTARPQKRRSSRSLQVPWSIQEIRRVAIRLAQRRIEPAFILAWSAWRRAHQAAAQHAHLKRHMQL